MIYEISDEVADREDIVNSLNKGEIPKGSKRRKDIEAAIKNMIDPDNWDDEPLDNLELSDIVGYKFGEVPE
uniref:Uncharacterized protein n=1 Tax=uncultured bacterium contig00046 TaxID=1181532 RepID=A0A806KAZ2_9BACT|nr:hypothetical protein [uncultured bacterium contig00046]